jgi:hypothetical protein
MCSKSSSIFKVLISARSLVPSSVARSHKKSGAKAVEAPALSKYMQNKLAIEKEKQRQQQLQQQGASAGAGSGTKRARADVAGTLGGAALGSAELFIPRLKRAKVIVPEGERWRYFALSCSRSGLVSTYLLLCTLCILYLHRARSVISRCCISPCQRNFQHCT